jgi:squalene-associated FAD-dependent desaturase
MTVFVLGGGVAGIAAALAALDRGRALELLEGRGRLGGRVFSFADRRLAADIDNGPHVMLGCYDAMRALLRRLGTEQLFVQPARLELRFREAGGRQSALALPRLPVRLAMPIALAKLRGWPAGARARALRGMLALLRGAPPAMSFAQWLARHAQDGAPRRFLWEPLCIAVMNAPPAAVSAAAFVQTLRTAFRGGARRAAIWVPRAPWSEILAAPARRAIEAAGGTVRCGAAVRGLRIEGGRVRALELASGAQEIGAGDLVISAAPWSVFAGWVGDDLVQALAAAPFVNVYFDYGDAAPLADEGPLVALVDGAPFQFVYRRPGDAPGRFALIAGASTALDGVPAASIEAQARAQLARYYPSAALHAAARVRVTKEPRATVVVAPQAPARRPPPGVWRGVANLWVCGDWTATGLPSTLEGAARSAALLPW